MEINNIAVFISGGGSTFKYIRDAIAGGELGDTKIAVVISSNPNAGGLKYADEAGISSISIPSGPALRYTPEEFGNNVLVILKAHNVDFICMAGFLKLMPENVIEQFRGRILNQHPAILKYGGPGMYGINVHRAVLAADEKRTAVTIHHASSVYDDGPVVIQAWIDITEGATAEELQKKLLPVEHIAYVTALKVLKAS